jgi:hypothetical protein
MTFLYTARQVFDQSTEKYGKSWNDYSEWAQLPHLTEIVSLDGLLNGIVPELEYDKADADDWNYIYTDGKFLTGFFTTPDYVLRKTGTQSRFNLLAIVINPEQDCKSVLLDGYEFMGYDLLEKEYGVSALTNCFGLVGMPSPTEVNTKGLIEDYTLAFVIQKRLLKNNPTVSHVDTNVIAIWRHKTIGR